MSLEQYKKKRDFGRTPEPKPKAKAKARPKSGGKPRAGAKPAGNARPGGVFVVQKHDATRLHYDVRLEVNGALASWAVPKGPSRDPGQKRLAVHVEDHPLDYGAFEGVIPEGEYGAGTVLLWDKGTWTSDDGDPARAIKRGKLSFTLDGSKLRGGWTLTRLRASRDGEDGDNWLLIKRDDEHAAPGDEAAILEAMPGSVKTGRSLGEISEAEGGTARQQRRARTRAAAEKGSPAPPKSKSARGSRLDPSAIAGARQAPMPHGLSPQLATLADAAPPGEEWVHEIKFDGYRLLAECEGRRVRLVTRAGHDWTARFAPLARAFAGLSLRSAIIDGEAAILDRAGHTSFQRLQNAIKARDFHDLVYFAFDLLYLDGYDLRRASLLERKEALRAIIPPVSEGALRFSEHLRGGGPAVRKNACELALEGIISKRADAPYTHTRSRTWLKVKCSRRQEFVVIGWSPPEGSRKHFGSLLLGAYDGDGKLVYTGRVGTGFTAASLRDLKKRLDAIARKTCPADEPPDRAESRGVHWVEPSLVAEVEFTQWTDDGRLRHPSFQGLREDKEAAQVRVEEPKTAVAGANESAGANGAPRRAPAPRKKTTKKRTKAAPKKAGKAAAKNPAKAATKEPAKAAVKEPASAQGKALGGSGGAVVAGVTISNPDRVLYPDQGVTKLGLARYYEAVGERMLPFLVDRPLSTVRCPRGRSEKCFFQKHLGETLGGPVKPLEIQEKSKKAAYISIDSMEGLITLVQFGVLEFHPWGSRAAAIEQPDLITFDLDPGEGVGFDRLKEAARRVRDELAGHGLESFLKTTGGKGLHVVAPLRPEAGWDAVKAFCERVAKDIVRAYPGEYVATMTKSKRTGKIFVDYFRNGRGATSIAPYSTRARAGAPVAMPLRWDELASLASPDQHDIRSAAQRVKRQKRDPWEGFHSTKQALPSA